MNTNHLLDAALAYAELGWPVFPCRPHGKAPIGAAAPHGVKDATTRADVIRRWWERHPHANIAVACGYPGPDVIDIDTKDGRDGMALYQRARDAHLLDDYAAIINTPSGGLHLWFEGTDQPGGAVGQKKALELKAVGGYVLLPPSRVIDTKYGFDGTYEVAEYRDTAGFVDFPAIRRLIDPPPRSRPRRLAGPDSWDGLVQHVTKQGEGNRNNALFWAACRAAETGAPAHVFVALADAGVAIGLSRHAADATVDSARKRAGRAA